MGRLAQRAVLLGPALAWWLALLAIPVALVLAYSFFERGTFGDVVYNFTLENYSRAVEALYLDVLWFSLEVALITTALALVIGYPAAYFIATRPPRWRTILLVLVVLPLWTSLLIRTYAWIVILNNEGLVNNTLESMGVIGAPLPLLNNQFAIVVGMLYGYLPLMILPLYAAIERLPPDLREASGDLGAGWWRTFRKVTVPLTRAGIAAGCIFVFVPTLANFIVPDLLGGGKSIMVANLIQREFLDSRDWPFGATLSLAIIALMLVVIAIQVWIVNRDRARMVDAA
jgi:spermidine/putrescine transport system permease protein